MSAVTRIKRFEIENFKSIARVTMDCRRINVIIGEPDTGKTNILEALGVLSWFGVGNRTLAEYVRMYPPYLLHGVFFKAITEKPIQLKIDGHALGIEYKDNETLLWNWGGGRRESNIARAYADPSQTFAAIKFFRPLHELMLKGSSSENSLLPPSGENIMYLLERNVGGLQEFADSLLEKSGVHLVYDSFNKQWVLGFIEGKALKTYPLNAISDTYKRMIFYAASLKSLKNSVIAVDEPDVYAFPPYPKQLGEMMARDEQNNQFFMTTHNPYFLMALVEKTPADDLAVFVAERSADGSTSLRSVSSPEKLGRIMELNSDVFFNLDKL